jgi:hypothetical protein
MEDAPMSVDVSPAPLPDCKPLYRLINQTRRLLRSSWVLTGLGLTIGLALGALVLTSLVDLIVPLWPSSQLEIPLWWGVTFIIPHIAAALRVASLCLVVIPAAWAFLVGVVLPFFRRLSAENVARRIEGHLPGIHNRLVSAIDLDAAHRHRPMSSVFFRKLLNEALERVHRFRPAMALDGQSLRRAGFFALGSTGAFAVLWCLFSSSLPTAMARIFQPLADIPPHSSVAYNVQPANADVLSKELVTFSAEITRGQPHKLWLEIYAGKGFDQKRFDLTPDKKKTSVWTCTIDCDSLADSLKKGFRYRILGGGTWSHEYRIKVVERPEILGVRTCVHYPAYMNLPQRRETSTQDNKKVIGPEGGQIEMEVQVRGHVANGALQVGHLARTRVPAEEQSERIWFTDKLPGGVKTEGTWSWEKRQGRGIHTEPAAIGPHSHWFENDPLGHKVAVGDTLFVNAFIVAGQEPRAILLQWHDGASWDHGALWGADHFPLEGKAAKKPMGLLPVSGKWVRLEVPASAVGLEDKVLRGMTFKLDGGQVYWHASGSVRTEKEGFVAEESFPMTLKEEGVWAGKFPLVGQGLFRAEFRSERGHANKNMDEIVYVAEADLPPQVVLVKPGADTSLTKPEPLPLTIDAFDDYGLEKISLLIRRGAGNEADAYERQVLHTFEQPVRNHTLVTYLKQAAKLSPGQEIRYAIEARDRKGQIARTRDFVLKISDDANAADKQLEAFEKSQDPFRDKVVQLIAEQKKVQDKVDKMSVQYAELTAKIDQINKDTLTGNLNTKIDPKTGKKEPDPTSKLDPELAKKLAELQKDLAALSKDEDKNAKTAEQLNTELARMAEQANQLQMLPRPIADQMHQTQQTFEQMVAQAMKDLTAKMTQSSDPNQGLPDLKGIKEKNDRVGKELEGIKNRLDALAKARQGLRDELTKALQELQKQLLNEAGGLTERELKELLEYIDKLRQDMKALQQRQQDLSDKTDKAGPKDVADNEKTQDDLDRDLEKMLEQARKLLAAKKKRKPMGDDPDFPDSPYTPDGKEVKVPPKEEDTNEPLPGQKDKKDPQGDKTGDAKKDDMDKEEPLFMPNLGGDKPIADKRFDKKKRPVKRKPGDKDDDAEARKSDLQDKQNQRMQDLDSAMKSLGSDKDTLGKMMDALQQAMKGNQKGQPGEADSAMDQLAQMLQSPRMQQAMAMAHRMRQGQRGQQAQPQAGQTPMGNREGGPLGNKPLGGDLSKFDPATRAVLLKLPPRLREEIRQGMEEKGPEAYKAFIDDYFNRLTKIKEPSKP